MSRLSVGSLFSGIGGLDLGLERTGMEVRWQVEIDKAAQSVLRRHWPDTALYDDVTALGGDIERVDLICGGFPCQDLSVAGRRAGLAGERSGLFYEFMRVVGELSPTWVLIENVPGLLSSNGGRDMGTVLGTVGELGYGWGYRVLDAQYFGVAQRRRRVFIVGCLGDAARAAQVLLEPESCSGDSPPRREAGTRVTGGVAACLNSGGNNGGFRTEPGEHLVAACASSKWAKGTGRPAGDECQNLVTHPLTSEGHDASEDGTGRGTPIVACGHDTGQGWWNESEIAGTLRAEGENRPSRPSNIVALAQNRRGELRTSEVMSPLTCGGGKPGEGYPCVAMTSEMSPHVECCPTLKAQPGGLGYHANVGMAVRRLTPVECERLQGFPDGWTDDQSDSARYRQLGNAVCVPVAEWIGRRIMEVASC